MAMLTQTDGVWTSTDANGIFTTTTDDVLGSANHIVLGQSSRLFWDKGFPEPLYNTYDNEASLSVEGHSEHHGATTTSATNEGTHISVPTDIAHPHFEQLEAHWADFSQVSGTVYTLRFRARATNPLGETLEGATIVPNIMSHDVDVEASQYTNNSNWYIYSYNYTAPSTGLVDLVFEFKLENLNSAWSVDGTIELDGFMIYEATTIQDQENWVSPVYYMAEEALDTYFTNDLPTKVKYSVGFYARCLQGSRTINYTLTDYKLGTQVENEYTGTLSMTSSFQLFTIDATSAIFNTHAIAVTLTNPDGAEVADIELYGYALYKTIDGYTYTPSVTAVYDDITSDILEVKWQLGHNSYYGAMPFEGTMEVKLTNVDRLYSPAFTESPLYGHMKENIRAVVQFKHPDQSTWTTLWTGWVNSYEVNIGKARERKATIKCNQGIYRFREGNIVINPYENERINTVMNMLVLNSGWVDGFYDEGFDPANYTEAEVWERIDTGVNSYEYVGDGWNIDISLERAMQDLLEAEDAKLIVNRRGGLELRNRTMYAYTGYPVKIIDIGDYNKTDYKYGGDLINTVEVSVTPKESAPDKVIWDSKGDVFAPAEGNSARFRLNFTFEEGMPKSIKNIQLNQDNMDVHVATRKRKNVEEEYSNPSEVDDPVVLANVTIVAEEVTEGEVYVYVQNDNNFNVYVAFVIRGDYIRSGEGITYVYEDADAIANYRAVHNKKITTKIATSANQTKSLADFRLVRDAYPNGEFTSFEVVAKDRENVEFIESLTVGDIILLSEYQSGETNKPHVVVGEQANVQNGIMKITYQLARLIDETYFRLGEPLDNNPLFV